MYVKRWVQLIAKKTGDGLPWRFVAAFLLFSMSMMQACSTHQVGDGNPLLLPSLDRAIVVKPEDADVLPWIVDHATSGTTILLEDGIYPIGSVLRFRGNHVTLRSKSGDREAVIIDGQYQGYLVQVSAEHITIADLTLKRARFHHIHVVGGGNHLRLSNLHLIDARQQFVKANPSGGFFCDHGTVTHCLFELTEEGRKQVDPIVGGCYTGGVDALSVVGWRVTDNRFENIYCTNGGLPTQMVLFWKTSKDPIVERNVILNCARGIGFGLGPQGGHRQYQDMPAVEQNEPAGHIGGAIRNNVIIGDIGRFFDTGIGLEQAWNVAVEGNIVYSSGGSFSSIDCRFPSSNPIVKDNLVKPDMTVRDGAKPIFENNKTLP